MQCAQCVLLFQVLARNVAWFRITRSYSSRPFLHALGVCNACVCVCVWCVVCGVCVCVYVCVCVCVCVEGGGRMVAYRVSTSDEQKGIHTTPDVREEEQYIYLDHHLAVQY